MNVFGTLWAPIVHVQGPAPLLCATINALVIIKIGLEHFAKMSKI